MEIIIGIIIILVVQIWMYIDWKKNKKIKETPKENLFQENRLNTAPLRADWTMTNMEISKFDSEKELSKHVKKKLLINLVDKLLKDDEFITLNNYMVYSKFESISFPYVTNYNLKIKLVQQK